MEIKKLLNPEPYDIPWQRRNWLNYDPVDWSELNELLTEFDIDPGEFDNFINVLHKERWAGLWDIKDRLNQTAEPDKANLYEIKQALDNIGQYKAIKFKIELDTGKANEIDKINITASEAIIPIYEFLKQLTNKNIQTGNVKKQSGAKLRFFFNSSNADIITLAYCFLNKHSQKDYFTTDKRYFAGLVFAAINVLDLPEKYDCSKYNNYRHYLTKKVNQFITAGKTLINRGKLDYSYTDAKGSKYDILNFDKNIVEKSIKELWG